jgi:DegV family protein with EDD domain
MVQILTGPRLARALRAGALAVAREQETLNRINVFPVPDADTGANLAGTLRAAAAALSTPRGITVGQTARTAADAALDGARGNSGAIFAQFLHGLAESIGNRVHVTTHEFAAAVARGSDAAQQALAQPVEGTIISVLRAWAVALEESSYRRHDFAELLRHGLDRAREALANTPKQLAVLARHGVVDAGAQGFVFFLEGVSSFFGDRRAASWRKAGLSLAQPTPFAAAHAEIDLTYRFCAEGLLVGERLDRKAIARSVSPLGGSLVVAGGGSRLRVHLHTNEPQRLFATLAEHGTVERTKIDDMVMQQLAAQGARIALVSDSACDMAEATAHALGLVRVPLSISFGEDTFIDGVDITPPQFYQKLAAAGVMPKTSQPAVGEFRSAFATLLANHEAVVSLHLSGGLSGTFQAAKAAAEQVDPTRIRVIDTRQVSAALGVIVEAVGEALAAGQGLDDAADLAERVSAQTALFAALPSLEMAARGGRVSRRLAWISRVLGLVPILTMRDGKAVKAGIHLGFAAALRGMARRVARFAQGAPARVVIAHASAVGAAEFLAERICQRLGVVDIPIVNLTAVLAAHTGAGGVGVGIRRLEC